MNNTDKFSGKADLYAKARPNYPSQLIDYLIERLSITNDTVIADVGSGTGKLSVEFLKHGCKVFCVEPNKDMRNAAERMLSEYSGFTSVNGTDADTTLADNSVNIVTVAQAFHWFDVDRFKAECKRILKQKGAVAVIYNHRTVGSDLVAENAEICKRFCLCFKGFSNKLNADAIAKIAFLFDYRYETVRFENNLTYSKELFVQRMLSASYAPTENASQYGEYVTALENLFDKYSNDNILTLPNETIAYIG